MPHIICVGACYIDTILDVPHFPTEDAKLRATHLSKRRGGNGPNTLEVLSQLHNSFNSYAKSLSNGRVPVPVTLSLVAVLPNAQSPDTEVIKSSLPGVNLDNCIYRAENIEAASSYVLRAGDSGSRTIVNYNELADMTVDEFIVCASRLGETCTGVDDDLVWWHFEGRLPEVTLQCIRHIKATFNHHISVEIENPNRPGLEALTELADIVFYSKGYATLTPPRVPIKTFTNPSTFLESLTPRISCLTFCTWADSGAAGVHNNDENEKNAPIHSSWPLPANSSVIDTIGAGDTFTSGILFTYATLRQSLVKREVLKKALDFAVELAGRKVLRRGFGGLGEVMEERVWGEMAEWGSGG